MLNLLSQIPINISFHTQIPLTKSDSSQGEGVSAEEEDNAGAGKSEIETSSNEQEASEGEDQQEHPHTQDTLTGVSSSASMRTPIQSPTLRRKSRPHGKSSTRTAPRRTASSSEEEPPTNEALRDGAR